MVASASIDGSRSVVNSVQSPSFFNNGKFTESSSYMYDVPYRQNTPIDDVENTEKIQNQLMENIRRLSEVSRLLSEFTQHGSANSSLNEIFKSLMIQMVSNCNRKKENMQIKNDNIKITQEEIKEFLRITKSTFGVFQIDKNDPLEKRYLLLYLVL